MLGQNVTKYTCSTQSQSIFLCHFSFWFAFFLWLMTHMTLICCVNLKYSSGAYKIVALSFARTEWVIHYTPPRTRVLDAHSWLGILCLSLVLRISQQKHVAHICTQYVCGQILPTPCHLFSGSLNAHVVHLVGRAPYDLRPPIIFTEIRPADKKCRVRYAQRTMGAISCASKLSSCGQSKKSDLRSSNWAPE